MRTSLNLFVAAALAALEAPQDAIHNQTFNVGRTEENYRIREIADIVAETVPGCRVEYAADGGPSLPAWSPDDQTKIIALLIRTGADPNAADKSGVGPLHRAVRNRCAAAVRALIEGGAELASRGDAPCRGGDAPGEEPEPVPKPLAFQDSLHRILQVIGT